MWLKWLPPVSVRHRKSSRGGAVMWLPIHECNLSMRPAPDGLSLSSVSLLVAPSMPGVVTSTALPSAWLERLPLVVTEPGRMPLIV